MFHGHPGVLHQVPEFFDTVQLRAVRRQKVEGDALAAQMFQVGRDGLRLVDGGVVQNDRQRLVCLLAEQPDEADEQLGSEGAPQLGAEHFAAAKQRRNHVHALAARRRNAVLLAHRRPGAAVRMSLGKARFIDIRQFDFSGLGLGP